MTGCHVEALACTTVSGSAGNTYGRVTVTIKDDCGGAVAGADVPVLRGRCSCLQSCSKNALTLAICPDIDRR